MDHTEMRVLPRGVCSVGGKHRQKTLLRGFENAFRFVLGGGCV